MGQRLRKQFVVGHAGTFCLGDEGESEGQTAVVAVQIFSGGHCSLHWPLLSPRHARERYNAPRKQFNDRRVLTLLQFSYPLESDAYHTPGQFLLGNDIIVAPAFSPVQDPPIPPQGGSPGGVVGVSLWVPPAPDAWVDFNAPATSAFAPGWMLYNASIFTVPVLARAGAVIPLLPRNLSSTPGISGQACEHTSWNCFHVITDIAQLLVPHVSAHPRWQRQRQRRCVRGRRLEHAVSGDIYNH